MSDTLTLAIMAFVMVMFLSLIMGLGRVKAYFNLVDKRRYPTELSTTRLGEMMGVGDVVLSNYKFGEEITYRLSISVSGANGESNSITLRGSDINTVIREGYDFMLDRGYLSSEK